MRQLIALTAVALLSALAISAISAEKPKPKEEPKERLAVIETSRGTIKFVLFEKQAPITTKNFVQLVGQKFYNGLKFHRVESWVIQGGDPKGDGTGGSDKTIKLETHASLNFDKSYTVGMARSQDPNSATSQFFITKQPASWLNGNYAVFGRVVEGQGVVDRIEKGDVMKKITIVNAPSTRKPAK